MLTRLYVGSYSGEMGHQFLQEPLILALSKSAETFIMVSISDMPTVQYWQNLGSMLDKSKEKIPKKLRIGDTCFMSLEAIGCNLFTRHPKNINHLHKDSIDLLSVIIILGEKNHGGETVFNDGVKMNDIGKRARGLKHSHKMCVVGAFDKNLHKCYIWTGHRSFLSFILHKSLFLYFLHHGTIFYDKYIT